MTARQRVTKSGDPTKSDRINEIRPTRTGPLDGPALKTPLLQNLLFVAKPILHREHHIWFRNKKATKNKTWQKFVAKKSSCGQSCVGRRDQISCWRRRDQNLWLQKLQLSLHFTMPSNTPKLILYMDDELEDAWGRTRNQMMAPTLVAGTTTWVLGQQLEDGGIRPMRMEGSAARVFQTNYALIPR